MDPKGILYRETFSVRDAGCGFKMCFGKKNFIDGKSKKQATYINKADWT